MTALKDESFDKSALRVCDEIERFRGSKIRALSCFALHDGFVSDAGTSMKMPGPGEMVSHGVGLLFDPDIGIVDHKSGGIRRTEFLTSFGSRGSCVNVISRYGKDMERRHGKPSGIGISFAQHCATARDRSAGAPHKFGVIMDARLGKRGAIRFVGMGGYAHPRSIEREFWMGLMMATSYRLAIRYEWTIAIGYEGDMRVVLPVARLSCNEVFRLRDIPDGRARRAAIRNFVVAHTRRAASGHEPSQVREHLRGAEHFNWNGLSITIAPPAYDVDRLAKEREAIGRRAEAKQASECIREAL